MEEKGGAPDGGMGDRGGNGREEAKRWRKRMGQAGEMGGRGVGWWRGDIERETKRRQERGWRKEGGGAG